MTTQLSLIGSSAVTRELLDHLERVAPTDAPVLVRGATGVGKELVAREIHRLSGREPQVTSLQLTVAPSPTSCWRASCLAMRRAPSQAQ